MAVSFAGVSLKNPVAVASGTFGFGREYGLRFDLSRLGAICVKGLTIAPRGGNPPPRVAETPMGMLNSVGLQNPGVEAFIQNELPFLRKYDVKIIANLSGETVAEYAELAGRLSDAGVDMLEVNISCPNVKAGGLAFGVDPASAAAVTRAVRDRSNVPVMVKLSPNVADIADIARAAEAAGADALSLINTLLGMRIDVNTRRPVLARGVGGLSGPAVRPVAVRCVWQTAQAVKIPIMGMGGVMTADDAAELMLAGASAVAVGTALFRDPEAPLDVIDGLAAYCARQGFTRAADLTGALR
ncbi:MAG: dihydroorotate dehydrogenase [Oscillospiraceae bacterium]|jgi:dihydroorotate dehydrogenase (NAD+) catalytic subunit|nr:dihydroorotate dehydrogenase [Oscillospiraceae bacterium]